MRRCLVRGSDEVFPWLGGSLGSLYHCTNCHYLGPIVIETDAEQVFEDRFGLFWNSLEEGSFWSETGIGSPMLFEA
jgi:hypothetical protein